MAGPSSVVDDQSSPAGIAGFFAGKYQDVYTTVQFYPVDMTDINNKIFNRISVNGFDGDCFVTCKDILQAVDKLNSGISDGNYSLTSDHFKAAGDDLYVYISCLFSGLLTDGVVPDDLAKSTVVSIPKGKNVNLTDSCNYRGIALSSIFGNMFHLVVLSRNGDRLCSSDLQFRCQAKRFTNMCTLILKEASSRCSRRMSPVVSFGSQVKSRFLK